MQNLVFQDYKLKSCSLEPPAASISHLPNFLSDRLADLHQTLSSLLEKDVIAPVLVKEWFQLLTCSSFQNLKREFDTSWISKLWMSSFRLRNSSVISSLLFRGTFAFYIKALDPILSLLCSPRIRRWTPVEVEAGLCFCLVICFWLSRRSSNSDGSWTFKNSHWNPTHHLKLSASSLGHSSGQKCFHRRNFSLCILRFELSSPGVIRLSPFYVSHR